MDSMSYGEEVALEKVRPKNYIFNNMVSEYTQTNQLKWFGHVRRVKIKNPLTKIIKLENTKIRK